MQVAVTVGPLPTTKVTAPVGAVPPPLTVADNVTLCPSVPDSFTTETVGVPGVAVPLTLIVCVEPGTFAELSIVTSDPEMDPAIVGANSTTCVHELPAPSVITAEPLESSGQVELASYAKFSDTLGFVPEEGGEIVSGAVPSFSSVTLCDALVCPTAVFG